MLLGPRGKGAYSSSCSDSSGEGSTSDSIRQVLWDPASPAKDRAACNIIIFRTAPGLFSQDAIRAHLKVDLQPVPCHHFFPATGFVPLRVRVVSCRRCGPSVCGKRKPPSMRMRL